MDSSNDWWVDIEANDKRFECECHPSCVNCKVSCDNFWYLATHGYNTWCKSPCKKQRLTSEVADNESGDCCCFDAMLTSCG